LNVIRIPRRNTRHVVMYQHGLLDSPAAWVSNGHIFSLAYRAYALGYDVFLGTYRGTSDDLGSGPQPSPTPGLDRKRHVRLSPSDSEYWCVCVNGDGLGGVARYWDSQGPLCPKYTCIRRDACTHMHHPWG
jgi:hypothetical protein